MNSHRVIIIIIIGEEEEYDQLHRNPSFSWPMMIPCEFANEI